MKKIGACLSDQVGLASRVVTCQIPIIIIEEEEEEEEEDTLPPTRCPGLTRKGVLNHCN